MKGFAVEQGLSVVQPRSLRLDGKFPEDARAARQALADAQLDVLVDRFASQPLVATPSQLPNPVLQVPSTHEPLEHAAPALAKEHALPQLPQLVTVVLVFVSQPFDAMPSQLPKPVEQVGTHAPVVHVVVP